MPVDVRNNFLLISPMPDPTAPLLFGVAPPEYRLPAATTLGPVSLQVANLARSTAYYRDVIGLRVSAQSGGVAIMTAQKSEVPLIALHERAGATPAPPQRRLGLFHVAILLPDRASLGRFLSHFATRNEQIGMSDHLVSEALYLTDPDGLGLEVYADRPANSWKAEQRQLRMSTDPLNIRAVIAAGGSTPWTGAPPGTRIGHVHLHVGDLSEAETFYHRVLGFNKTVWGYPGALFLAAGRYHHHLGTNTWAQHAEPAHEDEARLLEWTIEVPTADDVRALRQSCERNGVPVEAVTGLSDTVLVRDPLGTAIRIHAAAPA